MIELIEFKEKLKVIFGDSLLKEQFEFMNVIVKVKVIYSINGEIFQILLSDIMSWLIYDGKVDLDIE